MAKTHFFLIGYVLDNDPSTMEVEVEQHTLSDAQARDQIMARHPDAQSAQIHDVRVTEILHPKDESSDPGHNLQHADFNPLV